MTSGDVALAAVCAPAMLFVLLTGVFDLPKFLKGFTRK